MTRKSITRSTLSALAARGSSSVFFVVRMRRDPGSAERSLIGQTELNLSENGGRLLRRYFSVSCVLIGWRFAATGMLDWILEFIPQTPGHGAMRLLDGWGFRNSIGLASGEREALQPFVVCAKPCAPS